MGAETARIYGGGSAGFTSIGASSDATIGGSATVQGFVRSAPPTVKHLATAGDLLIASKNVVFADSPGGNLTWTGSFQPPPDPTKVCEVLVYNIDSANTITVTPGIGSNVKVASSAALTPKSSIRFLYEPASGDYIETGRCIH
jgi:hypothetical protein